jgi:hypothetical protein
VLLFFSAASYGLNEPQWYLFAALSIVLRGLARKRLEAGDAAATAVVETTSLRREQKRAQVAKPTSR